MCFGFCLVIISCYSHHCGSESLFSHSLLSLNEIAKARREEIDLDAANKTVVDSVVNFHSSLEEFYASLVKLLFDVCALVSFCLMFILFGHTKMPNWQSFSIAVGNNRTCRQLHISAALLHSAYYLLPI